MIPHSLQLRRAWILRAIALCILCAASSCGYSTGLGVAKSHESVGVEFFGNESLERDLEPLMYNEVSRALRDFADVPLVAPERADVVMRGTIKTYHRRPGIRSPENMLLETGVFIEAEASLYSPSQKLIKGPAHASIWVGYIIAGSENEREARDRALRRVAEDLVLELFAPTQ